MPLWEMDRDSACVILTAVGSGQYKSLHPMAIDLRGSERAGLCAMGHEESPGEEVERLRRVCAELLERVRSYERERVEIKDRLERILRLTIT